VIDRRRASTRDSVNLAASIRGFGHATPSRICNLSLGGAFLRQREPFFVGQRVRLTFELPGWGLLDATALVRWWNQDGAGVKFEGLRAGEIWALNQYLKSLVN
jgi:hypothetical protein